MEPCMRARFYRSMILLGIFALQLSAKTVQSASPYDGRMGLPSVPDTYQQASEYNEQVKEGEVDMGTTLVAIKFRDGVVVGADTRTSVSGYISNRLAHKITILWDGKHDSLNVVEYKDDNTEDNTDNKGKTSPSSAPSTPTSAAATAASVGDYITSCVVCRSGSAADTQWLARETRANFQSRQWKYGIDPSISQMAHYMRHVVSSASHELSASLICAGYDAKQQEASIYSVLPGGTLLEEGSYCVSGSGSTFLLGHIDALSAERPFSDYSRQETIDLVTRLVALAIGRDSSSGGLIRISVLTTGGLKQKTIAVPLALIDGGVKEGKSADLAGFAPAAVRPRSN